MAIPTLLAISLLTFGLVKIAPFDTVRNALGEELGGGLDPLKMAEIYGQRAALLNADVPIFYFSFRARALPDTLHKVFPPERKDRLVGLTEASGNWDLVNAYDRQLSEAARLTESLPDSIVSKAEGRGLISELLNQKDPEVAGLRIKQYRNQLDTSIALDPIKQGLEKLERLSFEISQEEPGTSAFFPVMRWHGTDNEYHNWLSGFVTGNLGLNKNRIPVIKELRPRMYNTLFINGLSLFLALLLSIPFGVWLSRHEGRRTEKWSRATLMFLNAIPAFWLGSLLILLFATPGQGLYLVKSTYAPIWDSSRQSFLEYAFSNFSKFTLPIATLVLQLFAVLALQMRSGMVTILSSDYIRTARAKGLSERSVYWKHAFLNGVFPMITVVAMLFPFVFTGSLVVEYLFSFPGMGTLTQNAFSTRDYPTLFAILMIASGLTVLGNLVADILYAWLDPRVRYQ